MMTLNEYLALGGVFGTVLILVLCIAFKWLVGPAKTPIRSEPCLADFVEYCRAHPHDRFWQALRNWSGYGYIYVSNRFLLHDVEEVKFTRHSASSYDLQDTFYWEGRER